MRQKAIIITGMHRSGTSLLTSILQQAGLFVGDNLIEGYADNVKGYYEELDFVQLHELIFKENNSHMYSNKSLNITSKHIKIADELIGKRKTHSVWGFKDPRTSLFLDFWKNRFQDSKFIFVYRNPILVINSLIKRKTEKRIERFPLYAIKAWINYNSQILSFYHNNKSECILFNIDEFIKKTPEAIQAINSKLGLKLKVEESDSKFDPNLYTRKTTSYKIRLINSIYYFKSNRILKELNRLSVKL